MKRPARSHRQRAPLPLAGRGRGWGSTRTESRSTQRLLQHAIGTHMRLVCGLPPVRFYHVGLHLRTPTPDPSPQGGGERAADAVNSRISYAIAPRKRERESTACDPHTVLFQSAALPAARVALETISSFDEQAADRANRVGADQGSATALSRARTAASLTCRRRRCYRRRCCGLRRYFADQTQHCGRRPSL
jgi:hypothetical protein